MRARLALLLPVLALAGLAAWWLGARRDAPEAAVPTDVDAAGNAARHVDERSFGTDPEYTPGVEAIVARDPELRELRAKIDLALETGEEVDELLSASRRAPPRTPSSRASRNSGPVES